MFCIYFNTLLHQHNMWSNTQKEKYNTISLHLFYIFDRAGVKLEPGWPCNGPLLRLAEDVAKRLIVAFDTKTGMPYGTINLRHGIPEGETTVTCTAGIGTLILEFGTLSRLTGDPLYEEVNVFAYETIYNNLYEGEMCLFIFLKNKIQP